jgi:uncharacterized protein YegL
VGRLLELAKPRNKVPLSVIAGGLMGLPDLINLRSQLNDYLTARKIDPASISKLAALKASTTAMLNAIQFERDHAGADNRVGLVTFSSDAAVLAPVTTQVAGLANAVQTLQTDGSTNMGAGLQTALDQLKGQPSPSIVLLTDGWNNDGMTNDQVLSGPTQAASAAHVPICSLGIGENPADVDQKLLLDIASRTGGGYRFVNGSTTLTGDLMACHQSLSGQVVADQRGTVKQGQVATQPGFTLPAGLHRLTLTLSWPGSQLDLRVTDPSGKQVGQGYPGTAVSRAAGLIEVTVMNPAAGHWGLAVAGTQTAAAGEQFVVLASSDGTTNSAHRDPVQGTGSAPVDDAERNLRLTEYLTGALAVVFVFLVIVRGFVRAARRVTRRRQPPGPVFVAPQPAYGGFPSAGQPGAYQPAGPQPGYQPPGVQSGSPQPAAPGFQPGLQPPQPPGQPGYQPGGQPGGYLPPVGAGGYQPPGPAGWAQPAYAGMTASARPTYASSPRSGGCLGCLLWLGLVVDLLIFGASVGALYLWTTPLLTFPG